MFEFFEKVRKHKIASISLTVGDRAISSKFSTPRVSKESTTPTFEKLFQKWRPFWIFEFFERVRELHEIISICRNFLLPGCLRSIYDNFSKKFQKWRPVWNLKWLPFLKIFVTVGVVYSLDTLVVENFDEIALFATVIFKKIRKFKMAANSDNFFKSGYSVR